MTLKNESAAALIPPSPFEAVRVSPELDGHTGTNRAGGNRPQIAATTDIDAITAWLARFIDSPNTFNNYRKEAERLLLWSTVATQKPVSSLTHEDLLVYQQFLIDPQPVQPNGSCALVVRSPARMPIGAPSPAP